MLTIKEAREARPPANRGRKDASLSLHTMDSDLNIAGFITETVAPDATGATVAFSDAERGRQPLALEDREEARSLGLWLRALQSFFQIRNHPFSETETAEAARRDWMNELRIARRALLQSTQLALLLAEPGRETPSAIEDGLSLPDALAQTEAKEDEATVPQDDAAISFAETMTNACAVCDAMMEARRVNIHAWVNLGKLLSEGLERSPLAERLMRASDYYAASSLQAPLIKIARSPGLPSAVSADVLAIFTALARMLQRLRVVERALRRDQPLKFLLPVFTLIHEEARSLVDFIETRAMRTEGMDETVFDTLDGTNYAISMELKKVFAHELTGLSALRQPTAVYARVENAHGLLRDCFQQSTVALAQLFEPTLEGAELFDTFQTKLQQSLDLRRDLWTLLLLVRRAERERDQRPIAPLIERLSEFREGSLRFLMYKDWEACERFMEEVAAARGAVELAPVLHRFGAYLETLHGQVNMRAVLANHPFDYPELEAAG